MCVCWEIGSCWIHILLLIFDVVGLLFLLGFMVYLGEKSIRWRSVFFHSLFFPRFHLSFSFQSGSIVLFSCSKVSIMYKQRHVAVLL